MNIRVDLNTPIKDGTEVVFRSPVDCSQVTGLKVYYIGDDGNASSKEFAFADAHGNNVGDIDHLFAENVAVKVILDVTTSMAFVQNADTNAYLEGRFAEVVTHTPQELTEEQQAQARKNIGAMQNGVADTDLDMQHHNLKNVTEITLDFGMSSSVTMSNFVDEGPRVHFGSRVNDGFKKVGLSNIADGKLDDDAATVGQLKAAVNPINEAVEDLTELMNDFNQDLGDILQEVKNAGAVKMIDNQDSTARVPLYDLENGVYVLKGYFKLNNTSSAATNANVSLSTETLSIVSGSTETKYVTLIFGSGKVARYDIAAESYKSYPVGNILGASGGFELLAETILTEDASLISWTQTKDGKPLTDYKDFFIYWVGKFEVAVNNQAWICRANSGQMYYTYTFINKGTANCAFWWEIKELYNDNNNTIWLANFPSTYLTSLPMEFDYYNQGLHGSNKAQSSDLCFNTTGYEIQSLQFGSLSDGAKMVAGSKALLFGRKR